MCNVPPSSSQNTLSSTRLDRSVWPESSVSLVGWSQGTRHTGRRCCAATVCYRWRTGHLTVFRIQRRTNGRRTGSLPWFSVPILGLLACKDSSSHHRCVYGMTRLRHLEQQYSRRCLIVQSSKEYQVCLVGACMHILPAFTIKTLREVRNRRCLRELRKTYEYNKNIDRNMYFFSKESRTRGHEVKLVKD